MAASEVFLVFFLGHILGDYYFQTRQIAEEKEWNQKRLLLHCLLYGDIMLVVALLLFPWKLALVSGLAMAVLHAGIDVLKMVYASRFLKNGEGDVRRRRNAYLIDQSAHLLLIIVSACMIARGGFGAGFRPVSFILAEMGCLISSAEILTILVLFLFVGKPANITIRFLLSAYKPANHLTTDQEKVDREGQRRAGAYIGSLERIVMLIFLFLHQYVAIGLILTAKSIARYNRIAEDSEFAEYYLLGTLLSILMVLAPYLLVTAAV